MLTLKFAAAALVLVGAKETRYVQLEFAATEAPQVPPSTVKGSARDPGDSETWAGLEFATVTRNGDVSPTCVAGTCAAVRDTSGTAPDPVTLTSCRPFAAVLLTARLAVRDPVSVGVKLTVTLHEPRPGNMAGQSLEKPKSEPPDGIVMAMFEIAEKPLLVTFNRTGLAAEPTVVVGNAAGDGETVRSPAGLDVMPTIGTWMR